MMLQVGLKNNSRSDKRTTLLCLKGRLVNILSRAFTLIELLLVVILLSVLAGLSIPNLPKHYARLQLQQTAEHIGYLMRYAQSASVVGQKEYKICCDTAQRTYVLREENFSGDHDLGAETGKDFTAVEGDKGRVFRVPQHLSWEAPSDCIGFYPDGVIDRAKIFLRTKNDEAMVVSTQEQRGRVSVFSATEE